MDGLSLDGCRLAVLGCGVMGSAIVSALVAAKKLELGQIRVTVNTDEELGKLDKALPGLRASCDNKSTAEWASVIILAYTD